MSARAGKEIEASRRPGFDVFLPSYQPQKRRCSKNSVSDMKVLREKQKQHQDLGASRHEFRGLLARGAPITVRFAIGTVGRPLSRPLRAPTYVPH